MGFRTVAAPLIPDSAILRALPPELAAINWKEGAEYVIFVRPIPQEEVQVHEMCTCSLPPPVALQKHGVAITQIPPNPILTFQAFWVYNFEVGTVWRLWISEECPNCHRRWWASDNTPEMDPSLN